MKHLDRIHIFGLLLMAAGACWIIAFIVTALGSTTIASEPSPVSIWRDEKTPTVIVSYTTATNMKRCYLMNSQGGQPIQIECPK